MKSSIPAILLTLAIASALAIAQSSPSSQPATLPRNLDRRLQDLVTLDAANTPLANVVDTLRQLTQTNLVVNWNALASADISRDTPLTLHVNDVPYEGVVRTLLELLPAEKAAGINYTAGDNILALTTNAQLGKSVEFHLRDVNHALSFSLAAAPATPAERQANGKILEQVLTAEMARAGEALDARHLLSMNDSSLAASFSERGFAVLDHAIGSFNQPLKIGQLAAGTQLTAPAKAADALLKSAGIKPETYAAIARNPDTYKGRFSFALLPGTADELAKDKPQIAGTLSDAGILLLGPRDTLRRRTLLAVYDLHDVIKRIAAKNKVKPAPTPLEVQSAVIQVLLTTFKPDTDGTWSTLEDLSKNPHASALFPAYGGLLVVFATPETHRAIAGALQDIAK